MKKKWLSMKRILGTIAMLLVCVFAFTGCGSQASNQASSSSPDKIKIGVSIWSSTDVLGSQCKRILDAAADALGVELVYVDQGHVSEKVTASVENLVASGCQGIIICNSSDTEMASASRRPTTMASTSHSSSASSTKTRTRTSTIRLSNPRTTSALSMRMK